MKIPNVRKRILDHIHFLKLWWKGDDREVKFRFSRWPQSGHYFRGGNTMFFALSFLEFKWEIPEEKKDVQ